MAFELVRQAITPIACWRDSVPPEARPPYAVVRLEEAEPLVGDDQAIRTLERWSVWLVVARDDEKKLRTMERSVLSVVPAVRTESGANAELQWVKYVVKIPGDAT